MLHRFFESQRLHSTSHVVDGLHEKLDEVIWKQALKGMKAGTEDFATRIIELHGEAGREWLERLPSLISSIEEQWGIRVEEPFLRLSYNYVAPAAYEDGTPAIIKLGVPGEHIEREIACLQHYAGRGAVALYAHDSRLGAMLLERVFPGTNISQLGESQATDAAARVMQLLHRLPPTETCLPTVGDWWKGFVRLRQTFGGGAGPLPGDMVDEAEKLYAELAASMEPPVLLHGDLHHENILAGERLPWCAIDPQGVIGEPAYEVGAFLRNPMPGLLAQPGLGKLLERRVAEFSERMGIDRRRIAGWGFSQAVLSGIWSLEDHGGGWEAAIEVARALRKFAIG